MAQNNWRWCNRCQGLFFAGINNRPLGVCPAGGIHSDVGSGNYELPGTGSGQGDWRWCNKCQGLFFAGVNSSPLMGVCPAGGNHSDKGSGNYVLATSGGGQSNWRWCNKCQGLFFAGINSGPLMGVCPAGGNHSDTGSGNYVLTSTGTAPQATLLSSLSLVNTSGGGIGFGCGDNGHVYLYNPSGGVWADLGTPAAGGSTLTQVAAVYQPTLNRIIVFVVNVNFTSSGIRPIAGGPLFDVYFNLVGFSPTWENQGMIPASVAPSGAEVGINGAFGGTAGPALLSTVYQSTADEIYLFLTGNDGNLYDFHLSGTDWVWEAHGTPPAATIQPYLASSSAAIYDSTTEQIYVFATDDSGNLWDRHGSGTTWAWYDHGTPAPAQVAAFPCAVFQPTTGQIFVFVPGGAAVYCNNWNGTEWVWSTLDTPGVPTNYAAAFDPTTGDIVLTATMNGGLMVSSWNGLSWSAWAGTGIDNIAPGVITIRGTGYLSAASPPQILAGLLYGSQNPITYGYLDESTKSWIWQAPATSA